MMQVVLTIWKVISFGKLWVGRLQDLVRVSDTKTLGFKQANEKSIYITTIPIG